MEAGPRYKEAMPAAALRPWIRCYYLLEARAGDAEGGAKAALEGLMVPDGHLELGFNLRGPRFDRTGSAWRERPRACVDEVFDATRRIRWQGRIRYVAVKFRFEAGLELLDLRPSAVAVHPLPLGELSWFCRRFTATPSIRSLARGSTPRRRPSGHDCRPCPIQSPGRSSRRSSPPLVTDTPA